MSEMMICEKFESCKNDTCNQIKPHKKGDSCEHGDCGWGELVKCVPFKDIRFTQTALETLGSHKTATEAMRDLKPKPMPTPDELIVVSEGMEYNLTRELVSGIPLHQIKAEYDAAWEKIQKFDVLKERYGVKK